jgi:putative nucleotidyltransferase with HDIG domain
LLGFCGLLLFGLASAVLFHLAPWYAALVPLTMTAMILAIAYDQPFALVVSFSLTLIIKLALGTNLEGQFLVLVSGLTVAILALKHVRTRLQLAKVGLMAGLTYAIMTVAVGLLTEQQGWFVAKEAVRSFLCGLVAGLLLVGLLPIIERVFGIVTDLSLLELADVTHPLLQELIRRAPGTYTHSMTVALLAEAAAKEIGANPLLTRVGACFHDVGKILKPHYFIENQAGENRHDGLAPAMSTLIIIGHVKDGIELGKQHRLPEEVIDFIEEHHGTTLVEYFYREATRTLEPNQVNGELEASFRYPGPKPHRKEIGVVMLADAVEGASRALSEPTPSSLRKLVHDILMKRLLDGQFDESGLNLTEIKTIEDSLCKNLIAMFHARVKYPEAQAAG